MAEYFDKFEKSKGTLVLHVAININLKENVKFREIKYTFRNL